MFLCEDPGMARRTNAARSASTRQALIGAVTDLLIERGWAATTAVAVCERAGLTRGALIHHYPNLASLMTDALESIYADLAADARPIQSEATSIIALVARLWSAMGDPRFKAVIESWLAAANDPELAKELSPAIERFSQLVTPGRQSRGGPVSSPDTRAFLLMARESMFGLALGRACNAGKPVSHERTVMTRLKNEAAAIDERQRKAIEE